PWSPARSGSLRLGSRFETHAPPRGKRDHGYWTMKTHNAARRHLPLRLALAAAGLALASYAGTPTTAHAQAITYAVGQSSTAQPSGDVMTLPLHGQIMLSVKGRATRVAVSDPNVADVQMLSGSGSRSGGVMLFANQPGNTEVQVWTQG